MQVSLNKVLCVPPGTDMSLLKQVKSRNLLDFFEDLIYFVRDVLDSFR